MSFFSNFVGKSLAGASFVASAMNIGTQMQLSQQEEDEADSRGRTQLVALKAFEMLAALSLIFDEEMGQLFNSVPLSIGVSAVIAGQAYNFYDYIQGPLAEDNRLERRSRSSILSAASLGLSTLGLTRSTFKGVFMMTLGIGAGVRNLIKEFHLERQREQGQEEELEVLLNN